MTRPLASSSLVSVSSSTRPASRPRFRPSPSNRRMGIHAEAAQELIAENTTPDQPSPPLLLVSMIAIQSIWSSSSSSAQHLNPANTDHLLGFLHQIIRRSRTNPYTLKLALFYIHQARRPLRQRISAATASTTTTNDPVLSGRKMFVAALMVASKYLLDRNYSNRAWSKIAGLPVQEINTNERVFLVLIDYRSHLDLDEFGVWSVRLQKLMKEKSIGADRSEQDQPSSARATSSSHSSPQRTSRPLSALSATNHTPSLKPSSPTKTLLHSRRPTLDLHTPIRQQTLRSDPLATAPPRIPQRALESPTRARQGPSELTTPIRQQTLPPVLARAIPSTAPAHLKPSASVYEPATPLRRSTTPARQCTTPLRQSSTPLRPTNTPLRPTNTHASEPTTPIRTQPPLHPDNKLPSTTHQPAPSSLSSQLTTPGRERMSPLLSRPPLSNARSDLRIKQTVYGTPAISNLASSSNPPITCSPSLRVHRQQPSLVGTSSSLRRSETITSYQSHVIPPTTGSSKRSVTTLENITSADVLQAEQDLMEKVAQEKALLAQPQQARRQIPSSSSSLLAKSSVQQHQQKRIDQQLAHERRMRDEEKKEHLRRLAAEKDRKYPIKPALELGQERWHRSTSIVSGLDPRREDHPSYPRRTEPSQLDRPYGHDIHLGQDDSSSDSEQSSSSESPLSDGLGYPLRTSGEISLVQNRLYGLSSRKEDPIISDYRKPSLPLSRPQPAPSLEARYTLDRGQKADADDHQSQLGLLRTHERAGFSHDQEPRDGRSVVSSDLSGSQCQARVPMGSLARGVTTPSSSERVNGSSGYLRQPTYRGVTPPLVSSRPLQSCGIQDGYYHHHHNHHQTPSAVARTPSIHQPLERRTDPSASRPPPALYTRPSPVRTDDTSGFPLAPRLTPSRTSILAHSHHNHSFSDPYLRPNHPRTPSSSTAALPLTRLTRPPSASASTTSSSTTASSTTASSHHPLDHPYYPLDHHHHPHLLHPSYYGLNSFNHLAAKPVY